MVKIMTYKPTHYLTSETIYYMQGVPIYDWEDEEYDGNTFLNALNLVSNFQEKL